MSLKKSLRLSRTLIKGRGSQQRSHLFAPSRSTIRPRAEASQSSLATSTSTSTSTSTPQNQLRESAAGHGTRRPVQEGDVFRTTLDEVLKVEQGRLNNSSGGVGGTPVPYILTCLLRAIEDLGGLDCEGIFRLSGKQTEEEALINRLNEGSYHIAKGTDPHVVASVLKLWLMSLSQPLIPPGLKTSCQEAKTPQQARDLVDGLPPLHREVIDTILDFMHTKLLLPKVVERTKMGPENLATVFGPCILAMGGHRDLASTMNVQELLADMKLQKDFTLLLMGCGVKKRDALPPPTLPIAPASWVAVSRKRGSGAPTPWEGGPNSPILARSSRERRPGGGGDDDEGEGRGAE